MKKIMFTAITLVIVTTTLLATNINPNDSEKNISTQILKLLDTPDFNIIEEVTINIIFTFNSVGEIIVLSVDSKDSDVLNYIREFLNHKVILNPGKRDKIYSIPLTVKKG